MESSQVLGGSSGKKHSDSTESGWTMYIGSQIFNSTQDYQTDPNDDDDEESDDSMASDASSGPIDHLRHKEGISEVVGLKSSKSKRNCEEAKKMRDERRVRRLSDKRLEHHQQTVPKADSCESQV